MFRDALFPFSLRAGRRQLGLKFLVLHRGAGGSGWAVFLGAPASFFLMARPSLDREAAASKAVEGAGPQISWGYMVKMFGR